MGKKVIRGWVGKSFNLKKIEWKKHAVIPPGHRTPSYFYNALQSLPVYKTRKDAERDLPLEGLPPKKVKITVEVED